MFWGKGDISYFNEKEGTAKIMERGSRWCQGIHRPQAHAMPKDTVVGSNSLRQYLKICYKSMLLAWEHSSGVISNSDRRTSFDFLWPQSIYLIQIIKLSYGMYACHKNEQISSESSVQDMSSCEPVQIVNATKYSQLHFFPFNTLLLWNCVPKSWL